MSQRDLFKSLKEVEIILKHTDPKLTKKVPQNFLEFMNECKDNTHHFRIDATKPLYEQNLMYETVIILSIILKTAWVDKRTLKEFQRKYNVGENQFKIDQEKQVHQINVEMQAMTVIRKDGFFKKVFNRIGKFFGVRKTKIRLPD